MFLGNFLGYYFFLLYILVWKVAQTALVTTTNAFISCLFVCLSENYDHSLLWKISLSYCVINQSCKLTVFKSTSCGVESSETFKITSGNKYCSFSCGLINPFHLQFPCFLEVCSLCWKVCTGELIYISSENWVIWCTITIYINIDLVFCEKPMY